MTDQPPQAPLDQPTLPVVAFKCRRPGCKGMEAMIISKPDSMSKIYCCTTCKHTQVVQLGGHFPF